MDKYVTVRDYYEKQCGCTAPSMINGKCIWNRKCNSRNIMYKITCRCCNMYYIGNTSRSFKQRTNEHVGDIRNYVINDEQSSALAEHFGNHIRSKFRDRLDNKFVRSMMKFEVLWKGDTLSCIHNFNSLNFHLCIAKKFKILKIIFCS